MVLTEYFQANRFQYSIRIGQYLMIPESQYSITILLQQMVALLVVFVLQVLASIQFNDETMFQTDEIDDIRPDGFLAFEFNGDCASDTTTWILRLSCGCAGVWHFW